ncbi:MAG TPA: hypothetical protein VGB17_02905 [Pyrinomonadaceae bacterium]|jgi:uncharacterized membrane protein
MTFQQLPQEGWSPILDAAGRLIQTLYNTFGFWGTFGLIALLLIVSGVYKRYNDKRKDRDTDRALKEKEKSLQRVAEEVRMWRVIVFVEKFGYTFEQAERLAMQNEFPDAVTARKAMEGDRPFPTKKPAKPSEEAGSGDK